MAIDFSVVLNVNIYLPFLHIHLPSMPTRRLERRLSIRDKRLKVGLVPRASLRCRLEGIILATVGIVTSGRGIRRTVRLTTRLNPHKRIRVGRASCSGRAHTKTGAVDVAPVTPLLAEASDGVAASVDDGLTWHASSLEERAKRLDVDLLVLALVPLSISGLGELSW